MKKITLSMLALALTITSFAQNADTKKGTKMKPGAGWEINPSLSLGATTIVVDGVSDDLFDPNYSAAIGVNIGYKLNSHVGFFTGLQLVPYNYKFTFFDGTDKIIVNYSERFVMIPLFIRAITSKQNKVGFMVDAGLNVGGLLSVRDKAVAYSNGVKVDQASNTSKEEYNILKVDYNLFLGLKIPASDKIAVNVGFDMQGGINNFLSDSYTNASSGRFGLAGSVSIRL